MILRSFILGLLISTGAFAQHATRVHTVSPLDSMVEPFPIDSVEPRYEHSFAFCPRADFTLKWFVRKNTYETVLEPDPVPGGHWLIPPTNQKEELVFEPRCVKKRTKIYGNEILFESHDDHTLNFRYNQIETACNGGYLYDSTGHSFCTADANCNNHPEIVGCHSLTLIDDLKLFDPKHPQSPGASRYLSF